MEGQVDEAEIVKDVKQHTYVDGDQYVFMDMVCQHPFSLFHYYNDTINTWHVDCMHHLLYWRWWVGYVWGDEIRPERSGW